MYKPFVEEYVNADNSKITKMFILLVLDSPSKESRKRKVGRLLVYIVYSLTRLIITMHF